MSEVEDEHLSASNGTERAVASSVSNITFFKRFALDDGRFTTTVGALLILGYCLPNAYIGESNENFLWPAALFFDWIRDLGIAFIVGGIVSLGIERISRQKFLSEAKKSREEFSPPSFYCKKASLKSRM